MILYIVAFTIYSACIAVVVVPLKMQFPLLDLCFFAVIVTY